MGGYIKGVKSIESWSRALNTRAKTKRVYDRHHKEAGMKSGSTFILLITLSFGAGASQFLFSKDTLFQNDSLKIINLSADTLIFDSLYADTVLGIPAHIINDPYMFQSVRYGLTVNFEVRPVMTALTYYGYRFNTTKDSVLYGTIAVGPKIRIAPFDSIYLTGLFMKGLAMPKKGTSLVAASTKDTLIFKMMFVSGSTRKPLYMKASTYVLLGGETLPRHANLQQSGAPGRANRVDLRGRGIAGATAKAAHLKRPAPGVYVDEKTKKIAL
jgi:hypothetical protein